MAWLPALLVLELFLLIALVVGSAHAQSTCVPGGGVTCTVNYQEWMLPHGYLNWDIPINNNALITDAAIARSIQSVPTVSQQVAQPLGTNINLQYPMVYGSPTTLKFGVSANVSDTGLTRTAAGVLTVDSNIVGNGNGIINPGGIQLHGAAPLNHLLLGNGSTYADSATLPPGLVPTPFYQTVQFANSSRPQENRLNFNGSFVVNDNPGNQSTDIGLSATGVAPGSYTGANITVTADGRITAAQSNFSGIKNGTAIGCSTPDGSSYATCTVTVNWAGGAFGDSNYVVACSGIGPSNPANAPNSGAAVVNGIVSKSPSGVVVQIATQRSTFVSFAEIDCIANHN